jgi:hypothetical protein
MGGCERYTGGYDTNPLLPSDADASTLFVGAQLGFTQFTEGYPAELASIWTQQITGAERQFQAYDVYTLTSQDIANDWATAYSQALKPLRLVQSKSSGVLSLKGAAEILEGIHMGTMASLWGDVPYSQAVQAPAINAPTYDAQLNVYAAVQNVLSAGIADFASAGNVGIKRDVFTSAGSASKWIMAAHSAKARYYMHVAKKQGYSAAALNAVITEANLGILTAANDMMMTHGTVQSGNQNIWYSFGVNDRSGYITATDAFAIKMLKAMHLDGKTDESGRLAYYFVNTDSSGTQWDLNYNAGGAYSIANSFPIIRASETNLLLAEAYARSNDAVNALTYLNAARAYNNAAFGNTSAAYVATDPQVATAAALLQTILNEEYLSLMHEIEAFNFIRRVNFGITYQDTAGTGVLHGITIQPKGNSTQFPQRFIYSDAELNSNPNMPPQTDLFTPTTANTP